MRDVQHDDEEEEAPVDGEGVVASRPNLVAQFPAHVLLQLKTAIPVAVDVARMHFFDDASGEPLR